MIENDVLKSIENRFNAVLELNNRAIASGACNYNPHLAVRKKHEEVGLHSNFLHSLLNPRGDHFRGSKFLYSFLRSMNAVDDSEETVKKLDGAKVTREKHKIDLLIEAEDHWYIIENKIYAADQDAQISRYINIVKEKYKADDSNITVIYLTLSGVSPSRKSLKTCTDKADWSIVTNEVNSVPLILASYQQVHAWCNQCLVQDYVTNSPTLYYSIASYKQVLDRLLVKAASGIPPLNEQCLSVITNEEFFLSLSENEQKKFIKAAESSPSNSGYNFLNRSLITNRKIQAPRMLLQSIFNGLLLRFRDGVYSAAAMHGFVIANSRDGFKLNGKNLKLLEGPINWYTKKVQRSGRNQFMAFKPRGADDGFWYVIYFAKYAFYHGLINVVDKNLKDIVPEISPLKNSANDGKPSRFKPYKWSPNGKLYVELLGVAHFEDMKFFGVVKRDDETTFNNYETVMKFLLDPEIFFARIMEPTMNEFWGRQDEGSDRSTRKLFLHVVD